MKLTRNNKFKKIRKTSNKRQNKKIRKTRNGKQNKRITKKQNNAQNKKIKGGEGEIKKITDFSKYFVKRNGVIGIGPMDQFIDRFICRNQDFSSLMNKKFVEDMAVKNNFLINPFVTNYAFNDSYNIPFIEPVLFELFDMCKFRIKKFYTLPFGGYIKLNVTDINIFKSSLYSSSRMGFFIYFFKELEKILNVENYEYDIKDDGIGRIDETIDETIDDEPAKSASMIDFMKSQLAKLNIWKEKENEKNKGAETYKGSLEVNSTDLNNIEIQTTESKNELLNRKNDDDDIVVINTAVRIEDDNTTANRIENEDDNGGFLDFSWESQLLSKLNKYIFVEDLIYPNRQHNITPFYTKKEAIIYLLRLLITLYNEDDSIDLYNNETLKEKLEQKINVENIYNVDYLDNEIVYDYLNFFIDNTDFNPEDKVYFSDILYKEDIFNKNTKRIEETEYITDANRIEEGEKQELQKFDEKYNNIPIILSLQKNIIDKLLAEILKDINDNNTNLNIIKNKSKIDQMENSFVKSYTKMIENRHNVIENKVKEYKDESRYTLIEQLHIFYKLIPDMGVKISHYSCSSAINWISTFVKSLILFYMGGMPVGLMAISCYTSAITFLSIMVIFRKSIYNDNKYVLRNTANKTIRYIGEKTGKVFNAITSTYQ